MSEIVTADQLVWDQSAFWYLAGMEDGRRSHDAQSGVLFPHGPTTELGKRFIRTYVTACEAAERESPGLPPYLPDFYQQWAEQDHHAMTRFRRASTPPTP